MYGQQQALLAQSAQAYGAKSVDTFAALNAHQLEVLRMLAKGEAGARVLEQLLRPDPKITIQTIEPGQAKPGPIKAFADPAQQFGAIVGTHCAACHNKAVKSWSKREDSLFQGGLDMEQWPTFSAAQKTVIQVRVTSGDMPRDPADPKKPGKPLSAQERAAFLLN